MNRSDARPIMLTLVLLNVDAMAEAISRMPDNPQGAKRLGSMGAYLVEKFPREKVMQMRSLSEVFSMKSVRAGVM